MKTVTSAFSAERYVNAPVSDLCLFGRARADRGHGLFTEPAEDRLRERSHGPALPDYRPCHADVPRRSAPPSNIRRTIISAAPTPCAWRAAGFPQPERISSILESSYEKLSRVDARNDSQVIFYDQVVPGSVLMGYVNADHWALAVPVSRTHTTIASLFVTQNAYPREALTEAILRFVEEDMATSGM